MLKQLAPSAVMPPSPKKNAWMTSAIETASIDAAGPSTTVASATPIACPVVPPGSGMLNIITTNEKAANERQPRHEARVQRPPQPAKRHLPERRGARVQRRAGDGLRYRRGCAR